MEDDKGHNYYINLNKQLISMNHHVPLESIQYNFFVSGISKICSAQASRSRIGTGHVSLSRRYTKQKHQFIYPMLDYIDTAEDAESIYRVMSMTVKDSLDVYEQITSKVIGVKKSDARYVVPVNTATSRHWWFNCRALRNFLQLRLTPEAEPEIRRLAYLLLDTVLVATPSLFQDIAEEFQGAINANV
jgi:thymidylate synthase (FAD)